MLDRSARSILFTALISCAALACGGDDDGDGDNPGDDGGNGGDDGGGDRPDAAVNSCAPVSGTNLALEAVVPGGLTDPVFVTSPPGDTRLFVLERAGKIKIVKNGQVLEQPFLDIDGKVNGPSPLSSGERGLLGLTFHPDYAQTGRFFVFYTTDQTEVADEADVVAQYLVSDDPDVANPDSEERILEVADFAGNHNGGMMAFGPDDGYLYIGMGDGGDANDPDNNGQDRTTLLGDMLRIDVDSDNPYAIPADNPLVGQGGGVRGEIWLSGLRNPWRWSFDMANGDMYIGDVGQGATEEVDVIPAGQKGLDLGWDEVEGEECFDDPGNGSDPDTDGNCVLGNHTGPVATYPHTGDASIIGGYVYRGTCFPDIAGWYFYADWNMTRVWKFVGRNGGNNTEITDDLDPDGVLSGISSFGQDIFGEVYIVSMLGGTIHRIVVE